MEVVWLVPESFPRPGQPVLREAGAQFRTLHTPAQEHRVFVQWAHAITSASDAEIAGLADSFSVSPRVLVPQVNLTRVAAAWDALGIPREAGIYNDEPVFTTGPWTFHLEWRGRWLEAPNPRSDRPLQLEAFPNGNVTLQFDAGANNETDYMAIVDQALAGRGLPIPAKPAVSGIAAPPTHRTTHAVSAAELGSCCSHGKANDLFACSLGRGRPGIPWPAPPASLERAS
ncbi:MAG: hypothetical protein ACYDBQ_07360 [Thermoplasmatota archaeon]